jgi:hypothetical protein
MEGTVEVDLERKKKDDCNSVVLSSFDTNKGSVQTQLLFQLLCHMFRSFTRIIKFCIEDLDISCLYQARGRFLCKTETCTLTIDVK